MRLIDPVTARQFAVDVVRTLREAGFEAFWAGGCVRDKLMGREPKDFDVATSAVPDQIRQVFGRRRTLPIGASFGVITVLGPESAGQIDVATFRRDSDYSDGRHPDHVTFCGAEEDARRRDFTINGLFYDPLDGRVLDYVGGQEDLEGCVVRAIGDPMARFGEDKLRMLRAIRFAATLGFDIEPATWSAIQAGARQIASVSAERITEELRRMLDHPARARAIELLRDAHLLHEILPEANGVLPRAEPAEEAAAFAWDRTLRVLEHLDHPPFAAALAALLREISLVRGPGQPWLPSLCGRWRLSRDRAETLIFCLENETVARSASRTPWPQLQRVLIDPRTPPLLCYAEAVSLALDGHTSEIDECRRKLALPAELLNPAPLIGGHDLLAAGIPRGPIYRRILERVRDAQLLGEVTDVDQAMKLARLLVDSDRPTVDSEAP
jgi:hypothetical protein